MKVSTVRNMIVDTQYLIVIHDAYYNYCEFIQFDYSESIDKYQENLKKIDAHPNAKVNFIQYNKAMGMLEIDCLDK